MERIESTMISRRHFVRHGAFVSGMAVATGAVAVRAAEDKKGKEGEGHEEEVSANEDLMREHGVLRRILLVYGDSRMRLIQGKDMPADVLGEAATFVRQFVEDYHERLEEEFLFPRFRKANRLVDLVEILDRQHKAGRAVTDRILTLTRNGLLKDEGAGTELARYLSQYIRMYRPHSAREDTVLFPAFREIVPRAEYDRLGEEFEEREHKLFGEGGFHLIVKRVDALEEKMAIHDLAQFTPKIR